MRGYSVAEDKEIWKLISLALMSLIVLAAHPEGLRRLGQLEALGRENGWDLRSAQRVTS